MTRSKESTIWHNNVEYVLPGIKKAMHREWAADFLERGIVYFTNLSVFRSSPHPERGDSLEGTGVAIHNSNRCETGDCNAVFICCFTMEQDPKRILETWNDRDAVIEITNPLELINRLSAKWSTHEQYVSFCVGPVTYDKDEGSYRRFHYVQHIFQKSQKHDDQKEYRLALVANPELEVEHVVLEIGPCADIARLLYSRSQKHKQVG